MTDSFENKPTTENNNTANHDSNWGVALFMGTLFAVLVFFWWLLIYSGGVTGNHG